MKAKQAFYSVPEAAKICGVSRATMWNWVKSGKVAAFATPGGHHRIRREEMARLMAGGPSGSAPPPAPSGKRLLIVDDDATVRTVYERRLGRLGYEVLCAANGFEAGVLTSQRRPDLVLLDLFMEGIDGFEVCRTIKQDPELKRIRILAISGAGGTDLEARILAEGADGFLPKSAGVAAIQVAIETLLKKA